MKLLILFLFSILFSSCSTYTWVDTSDCEEKVGVLAKCLEVK